VDSLTFTLPSFAKINWSLRILTKRPDGYHEVRTVLQTISLCDELHFESTPGTNLTFSCSEPQLPLDEHNLVVRAASMLRENAGATLGCHVHLEKRIPMQAGLGGGSSNAAVALVGLMRLWRLEVDQARLNRMAVQLGADVPFFLAGGCALGVGTGSEIQPLPDRERKYLLLVTPNARVSTAVAYNAFDSALTSPQAETILAGSQNERDFGNSDQWDLGNDFERVIFDMEPEIERAHAALLNAGARRAMLAGSGSTVFGIFDDLEAQMHASGIIEAEAGWRVFSCATISRSDFSRAMSALE
jgi:4-diphosphocytidyl-2-C-methyl-D-erythritol kinase